MPHVLPPYRADVVGSFLRPAAVAQARAAFARGELSREALTAVEDEEIAALVKKELDNGLTAVTDGEFRRAFWHLDFLAGLKGIRHVKAEAWSVHFEGRQPKAETVVIEDRLSFPADHPFLEAFARLKKIAGDAAVKYTIPSPSMLHLICCVRATDYEPIAAYKDNEELLLDDLAQTWTDAMLALYERGCRYLQLDDTSWGEFCSAEKRAAYAACGIDVDAVAHSYVGVLNRIIAAKPADLEALKAADAEGETVEAVVTDAIHTLGENIQLSRFALVEGGAVSSYIHGGGKIGVLVQFDVEGIDPASDGFKQFGRDVAMQVAAAAPVAATRESVDPAIVEHEKAIYMAQAAESGKPEAIQEKMATGRLEKFFKESTLTEQPFVKNPDQSVSEYAAEVAKNLGGEIKIVDFKRFVLGE